MFLGFALVLFGCQKDDQSINTSQQRQENPNINIKSYDEMLANHSFIQAFDYVTSNSSSDLSSRGADIEDSYGFTIDSTYIKEITTEHYKTYTMLITREESAPEYFENIMFVEVNEQITNAFVIKHNITTPLRSVEEDQGVSFGSEIELTSLDYGTEAITQGSDQCVIISILMCGYGDYPHPAGHNCINKEGDTDIYTMTLLICFGSGGGAFPNSDNNYPGNENPFDYENDNPYHWPVGGSPGGSQSYNAGYTNPILPTIRDLMMKLNPLIGDPEMSNQIRHFLENNPSVALKIGFYFGNNGETDESKEFIIEYLKIALKIPSAKLERFIELNDKIEANPWALIQDCAQQNGMNTQDYLQLYNHSIPQACKDRLNTLNQITPGYINQPISEGNVPLANIDYYGVEITNPPDFDNDGNPDTNTEIYQAFREKFTSLASGEQNNFQFSCDIPFNSTDTGDISWDFIPLMPQDGIDFTSTDPIASILLIEADASGILPSIATDDGAIIVSDFTNNYWTISTISTPGNGTQPFSGNRQWGWIINQNGNFEFFTRAVDVANISTLLNISSFGAANTECQQETYYDIADATWQNLQEEIKNWVENEGGGQATVNIPKTVHVKKETIEEVLTTNKSIDQILSDCN